MFCINKNSEEFKSLVKEVGYRDAVAYYLAKGYVDTEDTGFTPTSETSTGIKPGLQELFDSNPELANAVYEALGFKANYDKALKENKKLLEDKLIHPKAYDDFNNNLEQVYAQQKQQALQLYSQYLEQTGKQDIEGFKEFVGGDNTQSLNNSLFGLSTENQKQLEFHVNTLNVVSKFLENIGIETRFVPEFLAQDGSVVEGAIAAANFIQGTIDIADQSRIDIINNSNLTDQEKSELITNFWKKVNSKMPEEAAHWWYRLLKENSPLKKALWESHQTALKSEALYKTNYGTLPGITKAEDLTEEAIGQLIAEAIKRLENKNGNPADYSFVKKFLEWVRKTIEIFKKSISNLDPFEIAAMKILSSDMSDLMTWEEYRKLNNIVNFANVLTEQSVAPLDYTLITDIGELDFSTIYDTDSGENIFVYAFADSPWFNSKEELDIWVYNKYGEQIDKKQKQILQEVIDNQVFFDRLLNKTFRKKSRFLSKTLRKYFDIIDDQNLNPLSEWNISKELQQITKKLSEQEKKQIIETNGYTNIAPTLKVLPDILQKYKKNPIVLSEPIKIDGAKKQELSILNGIKDMIKLENPSLKSITAEEFVNEAHNWLQTNYLLGFANESTYLTYRTDQTFVRQTTPTENDIAEMYGTMPTEQEILAMDPTERDTFLRAIGVKENTGDIYHNKVSLRFNDMYHLRRGHFGKSPSAWGNLTYFYTGKNKWKDAVLLHEIQNDNIEFLREFKAEKSDLETSLGRYLQQLNEDLLNNIKQIESGGKKIVKKDIDLINSKYVQLNYKLKQIKNLPLEQGLSQLKESLNERIELFKSMRYMDLNTAKIKVDEAYSNKRKFQDFQNRGGIKSLLTQEELNNLGKILNALNERTVDLKQKKRAFEYQTKSIQVKINDKLREMYGDNAPLISLTAPGKPRTKLQIRQGAPRSEELNENVNFVIAYSEKQISKQLSINIELSKNNFIGTRNATIGNNFNILLSKITLEQYATLIENYKYNDDLLNRLIDEQVQKDILQSNNLQFQKESDLASIKNIIDLSNEGKNWSYKIKNNSFYTKTKEEAIEDIEAYYDADKKISKQQKEFENLKQKALNKKAELEKNYGKIEEEVKQTLEIEMNYFTPLVHHLIQKHINQYGKKVPMYFSGYNITKLTQGNERTAMIYAGKDEINIVDHSNFTYDDKEYIHDGNMNYTPLAFTIKSKENGVIQYRKINNEYSVRDNGLIRDITEQEYNKAKQEYEKAYQQATEKRAKEIKFEAAKQIGLIETKSTVPFRQDEDISLEEGIKRLNEYKKQSKQHLDRVINTIMNISGNKPIETGAIYNAMTQISGVKLIWQDKIEGLKGNTGGYLVDLSNYNYNTPVLYGLSQKSQENNSDDNRRLLVGEERKVIAKMLGLTKSKVGKKKKFEVIKFVDYYNKRNTEGRKFYVPFKLVQKGYGTDEFTWEIYDYGTGQMSMDFNRPVVDQKEETSPIVEELMTPQQIEKQRDFEDLVEKARLDEEMGIDRFGDSFGPETISLQKGYINPDTEPVLYQTYVNKYNEETGNNINGYEFLKDDEEDIFDMSPFYKFLDENDLQGLDLRYYDRGVVNFEEFNQDVIKNNNFNKGIDPIAGFPVPPSC